MSERRNGMRGQGPMTPATLTELDVAMLAEARRVVSVRDSDGTQEMSVYAVLVRKLMETSIKGSPYAQRVAFQILKEAIATEAEVKADAAAFWRGYQRKARRALAAAEKQGKPPPEFFPHPDDIVIDGANVITIEGAVTKDEARVYDHIAGQRDAFMRQHVIDGRRTRGQGKAQVGAQPTSAYLMAVMANGVLPKRLQLDELGMISLHYKFRAQTQRELLKDNYRAWKRLGLSRPRDAVSPSVGALESILPALALVTQDLNTSDGTDRDVEEALSRVVRIAASADL